MRPLIGVSSENATEGWDKAVAKAGAREVTARLVTAAVEEVQGAVNPRPAEEPPKPTKAELRQRFMNTFDGTPDPAEPAGESSDFPKKKVVSFPSTC